MTTDTFSEDVAVRLKKQLWEEEKLKRDLEIDDNARFGKVEKFTPIPYTPPVTVWKPNTATLRAFAYNVFKSIQP